MEHLIFKMRKYCFSITCITSDDDNS